MAETYTLSFHQGGDLARHGHNTRNDKQTGNSDIDPKKKHLNVTLIDEGTTKDAYQLLFQDAVDEYNAKQKNKDRIITNYHSKIKADPNKHLSYEVIIQLGSMKEGYPPNSKELLIKIVEDFQKKNPNLHVYGAFLHGDEKGGYHAHVSYIPFYHCKRGLTLKSSLTGALKEMGFKTYCRGDIVPDDVAFRFMTLPNKDFSSFLVNDNNELVYNGKKKLTAQIQWEQSQRDSIRDLCAQNNITLKKQGIGHKKYLTVSEYKELQEEEKAIKSKISELQSILLNLDTNRRFRQEDYDILTKKLNELQHKYNELQQHNFEWEKINSKKLKQSIELNKELDELKKYYENYGYIEKLMLDLMYENYPELIEEYQQRVYDIIDDQFEPFELEINMQDTDDIEL